MSRDALTNERSTHTQTYGFKLLMWAGAQTLFFMYFCNFSPKSNRHKDTLADTHCYVRTRIYIYTHTHICAHMWCWYFTPAVSVWCTKRDAPTQKCQRSRELGKKGVWSMEPPLSTATLLRKALWLHIALLCFLMKLNYWTRTAVSPWSYEEIMAPTLPPLSAPCPPSLSVWFLLFCTHNEALLHPFFDYFPALCLFCQLDVYKIKGG